MGRKVWRRRLGEREGKLMSSGLIEVGVSGWRTKSANVERKLCVSACREENVLLMSA